MQHSALLSTDHRKLWSPSAPESTGTWDLIRRVNAQHNLSLSSYEDLWNWSTSDTGLSPFWDTVWDATHVIGDKGSGAVRTLVFTLVPRPA